MWGDIMQLIFSYDLFIHFGFIHVNWTKKSWYFQNVIQHHCTIDHKIVRLLFLSLYWREKKVEKRTRPFVELVFFSGVRSLFFISVLKTSLTYLSCYLKDEYHCKEWLKEWEMPYHQRHFAELSHVNLIFEKKV